MVHAPNGAHLAAEDPDFFAYLNGFSYGGMKPLHRSLKRSYCFFTLAKVPRLLPYIVMPFVKYIDHISYSI